MHTEDGFEESDPEKQRFVLLAVARIMPAESELYLNGANIVTEIHDTLARMQQIVERIHAGQWRGFSGQPVDTIVNIGVGGSDLGPLMASTALADTRGTETHPLEIIFVSTMDGSQIAEHLDSFNKLEETSITKGKREIPPADWIRTRYQEKAEEQGRGAKFFNFINEK